MATRKAATTKSNPKATRVLQQSKPVQPVEPQKTSTSWLDYMRFGESYTSLILGIIVVIITTILLVFTVKDRSSLPANPSGNTTQEVSSTKIEPTLSDETVASIIDTGTPIPTVEPTATPEITTAPTAPKAATPTVKVQPTKVQPTVTIAPKATSVPTVTAMPTVKPSVVEKPTQAPANIGGEKSYTVTSGDSLWTIAEKFYKSGYNWVDIASANKLSSPGVLNVGQKLTIPNVAPKLATVETINATVFGPKIVGSTYTVQKGDHLWGIAVRAYGDGYKWTEIAKLNNITAPNVIEVGMVLKLPRTNAPPAK